MAIEGSYNPKSFESDLYKNWEEQGYFKASVDESKKPYTIVIPPPNVTGVLHMGHILNNTIQDTLIRWRRMQGFNTLWMPGSDHAGIATQNKVERSILAEGTTKEAIGREKFIERTWEWKEKYGGIISQQLRKIGASCDWSRECFTMDENFSNAVKEIFIKLYNDDLVYRGEYMVNWCPHDKTALADDEVNHVETQSKIWSIAYKIKDSNEMITIATTRPETILGDSAIAVHPTDERYSHLIGKKALVPLINREIPIIADEYVDKSFGTGALKITPSHDPNDFEIGKKHNLAFINIFTKEGKLNDVYPELAGVDRFDARVKIIDALKLSEQLVAEKALKNAIGHCYRCDTVVETRVSNQWFVKMKPLAEKALDVVKDGKIKILPKRWEKVYYNWLENIHDWCISRQIWWGHRIPAYFCQSCGEMSVGHDAPTACKKCGKTAFRQDEDVLDTWFSSWLWPFATMGWPENTAELKHFYPTSTLVTGADILFFWVARMIMAGLYELDEIPFEHVFLHGIVRDAEGRKMSKSLGNSPDPLDLIELYGADAIRFSFLYNTSQGSDTFYSDKMIEMGSNFANKLWNASKLVLMNTENILGKSIVKPDFSQLGEIDRWIMTRLQETIRLVNENMEKFYLNDAAKNIYDFLWKDYCDWYLEFSKVALYSDSVGMETKKQIKEVMLYVFNEGLKLLHPFMPYLTEKIFLEFKAPEPTIMLETYPSFDETQVDLQACKVVDMVQDLVKAVRNMRTEYAVLPSKKINAICVASEAALDTLSSFKQDVEKLAGLDSLTLTTEKDAELECAFALSGEVEVYLPLSGMIDAEKELERLNRELKRVEKDIEFVEKKVNNERFVAKAPVAVVQIEREKLNAYMAEREKIQLSIAKYA